jgi:membrane protein YdbS with pleckstrin-like domain
MTYLITGYPLIRHNQHTEWDRGTGRRRLALAATTTTTAASATTTTITTTASTIATASEHLSQLQQSNANKQG